MLFSLKTKLFAGRQSQPNSTERSGQASYYLSVTLIIAHRGAGEEENTIASFEEAINIGCDMIEFDIRRSGDNRLVIFHDEEVEGEKLSNLTHRQLNSKLGYPLPLLEELIALADGQIGLNAEIKDPLLGPAVAEAFDFFTSELIVSSFHQQAIVAAKKYNPSLKTGLVNVAEINPEERLRDSGADYLINHFALPRTTRVTQPLIPWTVNGSRRLARLLERDDVYGIITDHPEKALALRDQDSDRARKRPKSSQP